MTTPSSIFDARQRANEAIDDLWQDLVEKDDRTSPSEYPEMALITHDEFAAYINNVLETTVILSLADRVEKAERELAASRQEQDEAVQERVDELKDDADNFDKDCWRALRSLCVNRPGFDWKDYQDGIHAEEAREWIEEWLRETIRDSNARATAAEAALATARQAWLAYIDEYNLEHLPGCPEDDTCACPLIVKINNALKTSGGT